MPSIDQSQYDTDQTFCIIVGGGMCGVTLGAHLIKLGVLKNEEIRIMDDNADFGGVWESNKYPGVACDVPSHSYSMRYSLKPDWSMKYAPGGEIQGYYAHIADRQGLRKSTKFNTHVIEARWSEEELIWNVLTEHKVTGRRTKWKANVVVHAGGQFYKLKEANIPGKELFKGPIIHTGNWRDDIDLTGKRVGIIGTGPSTGQVAPKIAPIVKQLYVYQRSATFVMPRGDHPIPQWKKSLFSWFPPLLWLYHMWWYVSAERSKPMWFSGTKENKEAAAYSLAFLEKQVKDPVLLEKLRPRIEFGCKRTLFLDDYYPIYSRPNVELITDKPIRITETGIISKPVDQLPKDALDDPDGSYDLRARDPSAKETEREIDVLIWGTGFEMANQGGHFEVYGVNGINLGKLWGDSPRAYYSVGVSQFPNFFLMMGPNAANFWSSLPALVETQAKYNCKIIQHIKNKTKKGPYGMYVDDKVQKEYNEELQRKMPGPTIFSSNCYNYYTNDNGEAIYWSPFHGYHYAWRLLRPNFKDYIEFTQPASKSGGGNAALKSSKPV